MTVSEMVSANSRLWHTRKSQNRLLQSDDTSPRSTQILGAEPVPMANAAEHAVKNGAQIIDINMGCPAKKVCRKAAGAVLLRNESLVANILAAVVAKVDVPVTLKIRTGWDAQTKNAVNIARIAEQSGIAALTVHGRTRACSYQDEAEYDTIAEVKQQVSIPVIANGDIDSPEKAKQVLEYTGAEGVMIGRAAQGRPWIFREINQYLFDAPACEKEKVGFDKPNIFEQQQIILEHISQLYAFYGDYSGVRIARKHVAWYLKDHRQLQSFKKRFNRLATPEDQLSSLQHYFKHVMNEKGKAA